MCDSKNGRYCPGREPGRRQRRAAHTAQVAFTQAAERCAANPTDQTAHDELAAAAAAHDKAYGKWAATPHGQAALAAAADDADKAGLPLRADTIRDYASRVINKPGRPVPSDAIIPTDGTNRYKEIAVYDVDGTLTDTSGHVHLVERDHVDWNEFYSRVAAAPTHGWVVNLARADRAQGRQIVIVTARHAHNRARTAVWLGRSDVPSDGMFMRGAGDSRPAADVKKDVLSHLSKRGRVVRVVDDNDGVINMAHQEGYAAVHVPSPAPTGGWGPPPRSKFTGWQTHSDDLVDGLKRNGLKRRTHPVSHIGDAHITNQWEPEVPDAPPDATCEAVGYARNGRVETLVVAVNGSTARPDGRTYHVTLSRRADVPASESNELLREGWEPLLSRFPVRTRPFPAKA